MLKCYHNRLYSVVKLLSVSNQRSESSEFVHKHEPFAWKHARNLISLTRIVVRKFEIQIAAIR